MAAAPPRPTLAPLPVPASIDALDALLAALPGLAAGLCSLRPANRVRHLLAARYLEKSLPPGPSIGQALDWCSEAYVIDLPERTALGTLGTEDDEYRRWTPGRWVREQGEPATGCVQIGTAEFDSLTLEPPFELQPLPSARMPWEPPPALVDPPEAPGPRPVPAVLLGTSSYQAVIPHLDPIADYLWARHQADLWATARDHSRDVESATPRRAAARKWAQHRDALADPALAYAARWATWANYELASVLAGDNSAPPSTTERELSWV